MPKRMLIDASHPEETRVVVLDGQRVDEFDFESATKRPLKGNIYLAKVTRVEPSLQAAFVEYGGNRQGFLAFSEIHPDYYQIPVADRQALLAEQQEEARRRADDEFESVATGTAVVPDEQLEAEESEVIAPDDSESAEHEDAESEEEDHPSTDDIAESEVEAGFDTGQIGFADRSEEEPQETAPDAAEHGGPISIETLAAEESEEGIVDQQTAADAAIDEAEHEHRASEGSDAGAAEDIFDRQALSEDDSGSPDRSGPVEDRGSEQEPHASTQPLRSQRPSQRWVRRRHYKIQEVIKRKQIMLVQVVKEERGTKGAALTTYLSLAGRYCVLMPNTPRGGGISRKITSATDRNRLKAAAATLELPEGMGLIIRTAGANRTKLEIKRDYEYLLRMWDQIRELTLKSNAPACVYEEGDIIKRAIRDLYNKDVSEIVVEGEEGYKNAKEFMRMLMPSHAKNVKQYRDPLPVFQKHHIEAQLDAMFQPTVTLKSGGYIVINQTEALVSIDVNSGRATREHSIEETAHKTNLEAADEVGRQLRLRDLAGLIVIDFIDMEDSRNDRDVEKRLRDAVKNDRARVQIGKISQFGLLEMSRQRLRAGVVASSTVPCPHCGGQGIVRSVESTALRVLRALDEEGQRQRAQAVQVRVASEVALYTLNQKRRELARIETEYGMTVTFEPNADLMAGNFEIERTALRTQPLPPKPVVSAETGFATPTDLAEPIEEAEEEPEEFEEESDASGTQQPEANASSSTGSSGKKRRRRRRGRGGNKPPVLQEAIPAVEGAPGDVPSGEMQETPSSEDGSVREAHVHRADAGSNGSSPGAPPQGTSTSRRRRRRRKPRNSQGGTSAHAETNATADRSHMSADTQAGPAVPFHDDAVTPNAPSEPVWSFGSDAAADAAKSEPIGQQYYRREEPAAAPEPQSAHSAPEPEIHSRAEAREPEPVETDLAAPEAPARGKATTESPQSQRKGWWQRSFGRG